MSHTLIFVPGLKAVADYCKCCISSVCPDRDIYTTLLFSSAWLASAMHAECIVVGNFFFFVEQAFLALLKVSILNLDFGGYFSVLTCLILNKRLNRALNSVSIWIKRAVHLIIPMLYSGGHAEVNSRYFDTTQSC